MAHAPPMQLLPIERDGGVSLAVQDHPEDRTVWKWRKAAGDA